MAADNRGGPRQPDVKPRPPAGPGRLANRQDLSQPGPQPVRVPTGLPYGQRQAMEQAQASVPAPALRAAPAPAPPPQAGTQRAQGPGRIPTLAEILARPTNRPTEPITAGIPTGPGPGAITSAPDTGSVAAIIERAAAASGSDVLRELAQRARASGQ